MLFYVIFICFKWAACQWYHSTISEQLNMQIHASLPEHTYWKSASSKYPEKKSDFSFTQQPPHSVHHSGPHTPVQSAALLFLSSHLWFISDWCTANVQTVGLQFDSGYYVDMFFNLEIMIHALCGGTVRDYDKVMRHGGHLLYHLLPQCWWNSVQSFFYVKLMQLHKVSCLLWTNVFSQKPKASIDCSDPVPSPLFNIYACSFFPTVSELPFRIRTLNCHWTEYKSGTKLELIKQLRVNDGCNIFSSPYRLWRDPFYTVRNIGTMSLFQAKILSIVCQY